MIFVVVFRGMFILFEFLKIVCYEANFSESLRIIVRQVMTNTKRMNVSYDQNQPYSDFLWEVDHLVDSVDFLSEVNHLVDLVEHL